MLPQPSSSPRLFFEARLGVISCATALSLIAALGNFAVAMTLVLGGAEIEFREVGGSLHGGLVFLMLGIFGFYLAVRETRLLQDE